MIVITTPTGQIGSQLVQDLLAARQALRLIARDPAKLAPTVRDQVEVVQGSTDDEAVLHRALEGAESLFWVVPPSFTTNNVKEYYLQFTRPACAAIQKQGTRRVVAVSTTGRNSTLDTGLIADSLSMVDAFEATGVDFRALWCPSFMDNMLRQVEAIKHQGMFFQPGDPDFQTRFVATRDIAASAAKLLLDPTWTGQGGLAVLGPQDISLNDQAAVITEVLGKPVRFQPVPPEAYKAQLIQYGASEHFAQQLVTMYIAKDHGLDNAEPRTPENTTPTTFRQWCEQVLKPAVLN